MITEIRNALKERNLAEVARTASEIYGGSISRNSLKVIRDGKQTPRVDRFLAIAEALGFSVNITAPYTANADGTYTANGMTIKPCDGLYIVCENENLVQPFETLHEAAVFCKSHTV
jgi:hypothetical protein